MDLLLDQMEMGKLDFCSITGLGLMEGVPHLRSSSSRPHIQGSHNNHPGEVRNESMPFHKSTKKVPQDSREIVAEESFFEMIFPSPPHFCLAFSLQGFTFMAGWMSLLADEILPPGKRSPLPSPTGSKPPKMSFGLLGTSFVWLWSPLPTPPLPPPLALPCCPPPPPLPPPCCPLLPRCPRDGTTAATRRTWNMSDDGNMPYHSFHCHLET